MESAQRLMKRKLDDAIQSLDEAVSSDSPRPPPSKKSRSLYSTLLKYGIKSKSTAGPSKLDYLSISAPRLSAILSRKSAKSESLNPVTSTAALTAVPPSCLEYRPSSTSCFLSRLSTYRLATYANKPAQIDAVAASKCGWINDGRDRLACGVCKASWIVASTHGMNRAAAISLVEKQRAQLVSAHKEGCPWKSQQCDASVYRLPVQSPAAAAKEVKARALDLEPILADVQISHPLSLTQVQSLMAALATFNVSRPRSVESILLGHSQSPTPSDSPFEQEEPSVTAALVSLFGWNLPLLPPVGQSSASRASSVAPSTPGRTLSRASSVASFHDVDVNVTSTISRRDSKQHRDTTLLYCHMCQRRVGLWAFGPGVSDGNHRTGRRQFDVLKEHRPYCPYVVRSTVIPSLPMPSGHSAVLNGAVTSTGAPLSDAFNGQTAAVEGWRAILSIILKCRKRSVLTRGRTQNTGTRSAGSEASVPVEDMEVDRVELMVDGVKKRGGKELLQYVKGLLS